MFELNGKKYEAIEKPNKPSNKIALAAALMESMSTPYYAFDRPQHDPIPLPNIDLIEEYGKIERKESKLSANHRAIVVHRFEKTYRQVK